MDKYLLLPEKTYKKAMRSLQTVEMKQVLPKKDVDSLDIAAELDSAARSITDTLTVQAGKAKSEEVDSAYAITKTKEKYNLDQDIYMWYFRDILVLPDVRAAMQEKKEVAEKKKARQGFFKRLFGKKDKKKKAADTLQVDNATSDSTDVKKKKKSLNPFKRKTSKVASGDPEKKTDPARKEEDDGF
jgi:hypothetical protein